MREKERIVRRILGSVMTGRRPEDVRLATLGGEGLEARIWLENGIPQANGWLIDMSPSVIQRLADVLRQSSYHLVQGQLGRFRALLRHAEGETPSLDLLHLDFCGTIEPALGQLLGLHEIVARSRTRLLALTVSDQRRHPATDAPEQLLELLFHLVGGRDAHALKVDIRSRADHLQQVGFTAGETRPFTLRELSTVISLFLAQLRAKATQERYRDLGRAWRRLKSSDRMWYPASMERFVYSSRGYRMRTYVWRLAPRPVAPATAVKRLVGAWLSAPCWLVLPHTDELVQIEPRLGAEFQQTEEADMANVGGDAVLDDAIARVRLALQHMSPKLNEDVELIIGRAEAKVSSFGRISDALETLRRELGIPVPVPVARERLPPVAPTPAANSPRSAKKRGRTDRNSDEIAALDELRLQMLEAMKRGPDELERTKKELAKTHFPRQKKQLLRIGTVFARCQGKHRPEFLSRMLMRDRSKADTIAAKLASLYGISTDAVLKEARAAKNWQDA